jgi:hypothetical protein
MNDETPMSRELRDGDGGIPGWHIVGEGVRRAFGAITNVVGDVGPDLLMAVFSAEMTTLGVAATAAAMGVKTVLSLNRYREGKLFVAQVQGLADTVAEIQRQVAELPTAMKVDFKTRIVDPDVVFLLKSAIDHYAIAHAGDRMKRFAAVVARRVVEPDRAIDLDLIFAKAALELTDEVVTFMAAMHRKACREMYAHEYKIGDEADAVAGAASTLSAAHDLGDVTDSEAALHLRVGMTRAIGFGLLEQNFPSGRLAIDHGGLAETSGVQVPEPTYQLTTWGMQFISRVRASH